MLAVLVLVSLLSLSVYGHTTAVCNVVSSDGKSVTLYAGTYHYASEIVSYGQGGLLLTTPGGVTTRYEWNGFTAHNPANSPAIAPTCGAGGTQSCDCDACPTASHIQQHNWHRKVVSNLVDGCYSVITTTDSIIEWPWPGCFPLGFCVTGSVATGTPTGSPTPRPTDNPTPRPTPPCQDYIYVADGTPRNRDEAQCKCKEDYGTDLATIVTQEQLECALQLLGANGPSAWIGLISYSNIGFFQYPDGTPCPLANNGQYSGACVGPPFWVNGHPINCDVGSRCVRLIEQSLLNNDVPCDNDLMAFLCNKPGVDYTPSNAKTVGLNNDIVNDNDINNKSLWLTNNTSSILSVLALIGLILFVFINNTFICYYCICKKEQQQQQTKVLDDDEDDI